MPAHLPGVESASDITPTEASIQNGRLARQLIEAAPDAMVIVNKSGVIILVNQRAEQMFDYPREELLGQPVEMLIPEPLRERHISHRAVYADQPHVRLMGQGLDLYALRRGGREFPVEIMLSPLNFGGQLLVSAAIRDISERKRAVRDQAYLASIVRFSSEAIVGFALDGTITAWNPAAERIFGYSHDQAIGRHCALLVPPDRAAEQQLLLPAVARGETIIGFETVRRCRDGRLIDVVLSLAPIRDERGNVIACTAVMQDISDRKRVEFELRGSEKRFRDLLSALPTAVYTCDPEGRITFWNKRTVELWGREPSPDDRWCGAAAVYLQDGSALKPEQCPVAVALREGRAAPQELIVERPDGSRRHARSYPQAIRNGLGAVTGAVDVMVDITEHKRAEAALLRSESRLQLALEATNLGIWEWDIATDKIQWSKTLYEITGVSPEDFTEDAASQQRLVHPEDVEAVRHACEAVREGKPFAAEYRIIRHDGEVRWVESHGRTDYDTGGNPLCIVGTIADITARKLAEAELQSQRLTLERLLDTRTRELSIASEQLHEAEHMAIVGTIAAGLVHDFNNLLLPIRSRVQGLRERQPDHDAAGHIDSIIRATDYLQDLCTRVRTLMARGPESETADSATDLHEWWREVSTLIESVLPRSVELESVIPSDLPKVAVPRTQLTQAVLNLAHNAGRAMKHQPSGRLSVRAALAQNQEAVRLIVADSGPGMSPEVQERCLEPFFTTDARGTGMGLALVSSIISRASGSIKIDSEPGRGTTFTLVLPIAGDDSKIEDKR